MKTEVVSFRIPVKEKEHYSSIAKDKGMSINEYSKKLLYLSDKEMLVVNKKLISDKYVDLVNQVNLIDDGEIRKSIRNGLEEIICLLLQ